VSTDYQQAREALGVRLRELRLSAPGRRLTGAELAEQHGWNKSKVSRLENGKQTPTPGDLRKWAEAAGQPEATRSWSRACGASSPTSGHGGVSWRRGTGRFRTPT